MKFFYKAFGKKKVEITEDEFFLGNENHYKPGRLDRAIKRMKKSLKFRNPAGFYYVEA